MNIIKVQFKSRWGTRPYGPEYSYFCDIEGIQPGEWVIAPSKYGAKEAMVTAINLAECDVPLDVFPNLKTISSRLEVKPDA